MEKQASSFCGFTFDDIKWWMHPDYVSRPHFITHNDKLIIIQFRGWCVNLYADGSYSVEVTEGG